MELKVHERVGKHPLIELPRRYSETYNFFMNGLYLQYLWPIRYFTPSM